jgi:hypothetical protein
MPRDTPIYDNARERVDELHGELERRLRRDGLSDDDVALLGDAAIASAVLAVVEELHGAAGDVRQELRLGIDDVRRELRDVNLCARGFEL